MVVKPAPGHYQEILRLILGLPLFAGFYYLVYYGGHSEAVPELLRDRALFFEAFETALGLVMYAAIAVGLDRAMKPLLVRLSQKPWLELTPKGLRYIYRNNHADITFQEIEAVEHAGDGASAILIQMKTGVAYELDGYEDMTLIAQHLSAGMSKGPNAGK